VREIFKDLVAIMHKGFVVIEYEIDGDDPMPGVICILASMRGVVAGMGYENHA
jgi:hypothetical protein